MKYISSLFFCFFVLISCSEISKVSSDNKCISEKDAKEIVAREIAESDYYQQFYVVSSEKYDERVTDITWGDVVLVSVIPDGRFFEEETKYYLLTGVLSNGQVLVAQTVNAFTGELMDGVLLASEDSDRLALASVNSVSNYVSRTGYSPEFLEAVYYFDGTPFTIDTIFSWKYCVNTEDKRSIYDDRTKINDCIFIDPWVRLGENDSNSELQISNAFFSKFSFNHRAYRIGNVTADSTCRTLSSDGGRRNLFEPID
ncbi:MAG: hypothetical protein IJP62_11455 [Treponema sp.]|nr:hypothetical protein [Treponema sp.]